MHLRAIGGEHHHSDQTGVCAQLQHLPEQGGQRRLVALADDAEPEVQTDHRDGGESAVPAVEVKQGGQVDVGHPVGIRGAQPPATD